MNIKQKEKLKRIIITIVLLVTSLVVPKIISDEIYSKYNISGEQLELILSIVPYLYIGHDILKKAFKKLKKRQAFDENFLMSLATIGAYAMGESHEAVMVMLLYQLGEFFQDIAVSKSRNNVTNLIKLKPQVAYIEDANGSIQEKDPKDVKVGDIIVVKAGEKIPLDGIIIEGESLLNTSLLTGESLPRLVKKNDIVNAGMISENGVLKISVKKLYDDSTISKMIALIENAGARKSVSEKFISNFARIYTPVVCIIALLIFIVPSIYCLIIKDYIGIRVWGYRALTSLVISCPCSILISVPLAFFAIIGGVSKKGILFKGSNYVETLSKVKEVLFDKTGTMTKGVFEVIGIHHSKMTEDDILRIAAHVEFYSNHPIAKCIVKKYGKDIDEKIISDVKEIGGHGISADINGMKVLLGNNVLMKDNDIEYVDCHDIGTVVHVAINGQYEGHILVNDIIKKESKASIDMLHDMKITTAMLTGDRKDVAMAVSSSLNINRIYSELLPDDKLRIVEDKIKEKSANEKVAFVGDGINDAAAIRLSDVGIAMGGVGSDEAIEVSEIVIMDDNPIKIPLSIKFAKKCMLVVYENIIFSIVIKALFLILSGIGISHMAFATFADVGVMIICVLNSIRLLFVK